MAPTPRTRERGWASPRLRRVAHEVIELSDSGVGSAFGRCLRRYRSAVGWSQAKLAAASGMSVRALRDLENGRAAAPQERSAELLASALGLTGDERVSFLVLAKEGRRRCNRVEDRASLHALPAVSHLVGRERELRWLSGEAEAGGTVVLAGPPGVGKTTLAVTAAHRLSEQFPDGCLAIDLRGVDDRPMSPHAALERLLTWLGVPASRVPRSEGERVSLYRALLRDRWVLVLLDDALDEAQVEPLLGNGEHSLTIVTCRRALLNLESARRLSLDVLIAADAVRLVESILGQDVVRQEPEGAEELVSLCGNLPLAVRLVGNRLATRGLSIPYLVRQLHDERLRLDALSAGDLNLRSVLEVSFRRLSPRARSVFRRLALIPGADFDDDLAAVVAGVPVEEVARSLDELVEMSLLSTTTSPERLRFHNLLLLFARERLAADEPEHVRHRLRDALHSYVFERGRAAAEVFYAETRDVSPDNPFPSREEAGEWLRRESETWTAVHREALRLGRYREVYDFAWSLSGNLVTGELVNRWDETFEVGLRAARALGDRGAEANMLGALGWSLSMSAGDDEGALATLRAASDLAAEIGHSGTFVVAYASTGLVLTRLGRVREALEHVEHARRLLPGHDFLRTRMWVVAAAAGVLAAAGRFEEALEVNGELLAEIERRRDEASAAFVKKVEILLRAEVADCLAGLGRWAEAARTYSAVRRESCSTPVGYRTAAGVALAEGRAWRMAGEPERARTCFAHAREMLAGPTDGVERERAETELALLGG